MLLTGGTHTPDRLLYLDHKCLLGKCQSRQAPEIYGRKLRECFSYNKAQKK